MLGVDQTAGETFQALSTRQYVIVKVEVRGYGTMSAKQGIVAVRGTLAVRSLRFSDVVAVRRA